MRPNRQQIFRTDAAAKLDQLELDRGASGTRRHQQPRLHQRDQLGVFASGRGRTHKRLLKLRAIARGTQSTAVRVVSATMAIARSRQVRAAVHAVFAFAIDFTVVLSVASAAVIILTAAFLLTAPPV